MLSSAHVLAMDAKNLLDVVDSIRVQYPRVDQLIVRLVTCSYKYSTVYATFASTAEF
jgi:hypothetical protein